jgi:hypothetical protein
MTSPLEPAALMRYAEEAEVNDESYVAEIATATASEEFANVELLLVAAGVPRTFDLDREQATALRDQLTEELARLELPADLEQ